MNIPKPADSTWTDDQWNAIVSTGQDILVAAAAGSGKTAVLVERMIRKITAEENPIDVDRLLVVTFTNASAAEMKSDGVAPAFSRNVAISLTVGVVMVQSFELYLSCASHDRIQLTYTCQLSLARAIFCYF